MKPRLLRLPAPFAGYWHVQRRPRPLPFHWRSLTGAEGISSYGQRQEMILVLSACGLTNEYSLMLLSRTTYCLANVFT